MELFLVFAFVVVVGATLGFVSDIFRRRRAHRRGGVDAGAGAGYYGFYSGGDGDGGRDHGGGPGGDHGNGGGWFDGGGGGWGGGGGGDGGGGGGGS